MRQLSLFGLVLAVLIVSCGSPTGNSAKDITLKGRGWFIQNAPADYSSQNQAKLLYHFGVGLSDNALAGDLTEARIYLPDGAYWSLEKSEFLESTHSWSLYCSWRDNQGALPLGTLPVVVTLADGRKLETSFTTNQPGSTSGGYSRVYNEEGSPAGGIQALRRPTVTSAVKNTAAGTLTVSFAENDYRAFNGWVWVYDAGGTFLGGFYYFRPSAQGSYTTLLNGGTGLKTDGTANTLTVTAADLETSAGAAFSSAQLSSSAFVRVVVCDGGQYPQLSVVDYDYRSVSSLGTVTGN